MKTVSKIKTTSKMKRNNVITYSHGICFFFVLFVLQGVSKNCSHLVFCQFLSSLLGLEIRFYSFLKSTFNGLLKISKLLILGAKFAKKFTILYKLTKAFFNKNVHLKSVSKHEGQVKRGHQCEWRHLRGGAQVVEYQVKSTSQNELLRYITISTMECCSVKNKP